MRRSCLRCLSVLIIPAVSACQRGDTPAPGNGKVAQSGAARTCDVRGVWLLDSVYVDGKPEARTDVKQMKVIAESHYSWIAQEGGARALATTADSLAAYRTRGSGGGTYRVTDSTYIERLELFSDPRQVGREIEITCRIANNRWEHEFDWPVTENGQTRTVRTREIWHRVE
jgi:hypothetical protein